MTTECSNPYPGPESFERNDGRPYFGREKETSDLSSMAVTERLMVFYAPSGAGKTSLLNKRLIPRLEEKLYEVLPAARVSGAASVPAGVRNIYAYNLMLRLVPDDPQPERFANLSLSDFLWDLSTENGKTYFYDPGDQALRKTTPARDLWPRMLILDQFEEIVTTYPAYWRHREDFFRQVDEALRADPMLRVLISLRSDYVQDLERYAGLLQHGLRARYQMLLMGTRDALSAIEGPAEACERSFVPGVARRLVENLSQVRDEDAEGHMFTVPGEDVEPIQLQVVCYQLWESMKGAPGDRIEMADLWRLACRLQPSKTQPSGLEEENKLLSVFIDGALGAFYERALAESLSSASAHVDEAFLRNWFSEQLITESGARSFLQRGQEETGGVPEEVVQKLIDNHLLRSDTRGTIRLVELIHDRFVDPIIDANLEWNQRRRRAQPWIDAAYSWYESGDSPETRNSILLLTDPALKAVLIETQGHHLEPAVAEYLKASVKAQQTREQEAALNAERIKAEEATHAARQLRRRGIALAVLAGGIGLLLLIVGTLALNLDKTNGELTTERDTVKEQNKQLGEQNITLGVSRTQLIEVNANLEVEKDRANAARDEAESLRVASLARDMLWDDPTEALLLSLAADTFLTSTHETRSALLAALINDASVSSQVDSGFQEASLRRNILRHDGEITALAVSPDGSTLLTASGPNVYTWSGLTGPDPISHTLVTQDNLDVEQVAFAEKGDSAILLNSDGTVTIVDVNAGESISTSIDFEGLETYSEPSAISPDGSILAVGSCSSDGEDNCSRNQLIMWDLAEQKRMIGEPLRLRSNTSNVTSLAFDTDGHVLAAGSDEGVVHIWGVPGSDDRLPLVQKIHNRAISAMAFDPTGSFLATATEDGVSLWTVEDDRLVKRNEIDSAEVRQLAFNRSGQMLVTADNYGFVSLWDTVDGQRIGSELAHNSNYEEKPLDSIAFVTNQELLLTAGSDGRAIVWRLDEDSWRSIACERAGRNLEYAEWERAFENKPYRKICDDLPIHSSVMQAKIDEGRQLARNCSPNDTIDALTQFRAALVMDPNQDLIPAAEVVRVLKDQARVRLREGNENIARDCLEVANQLVMDEDLDSTSITDPDNMIAASRQLNVLYDQIQGLVESGAYEDALDLLGQAVGVNQTMGQTDPFLINMYFDLCQTANSLGSSQQAFLACQRVTELAPRIETGETVSGDIADGNVYAFSGSAGQVVRIALNEGGSHIDTLLRVWHADGNLLDSNDDSGNSFNSLINGLLLKENEILVVEPGAYEDEGAYLLSLDELQTRPLAVGERQGGGFGDNILWTLDGTPGQLVRVVLEADQNSVQPMVEIRDPVGNTLDNIADSGSGANALTSDVLFLSTGAYAIVPSTSDGQGSYEVAVEEVEPVSLNFGQTARGDIEDGTVWQFAGNAGETLRIAMNDDGSDIDPVLDVKDVAGTTIAHDDDGGSGYNSLIPTLVLPTDGMYFVSPSAYGDYGSYTLSVEENEQQPIELGETVYGNIEDGGIWRFAGETGQIVRIALDEDGSGIDPSLEIRDSSGNVIAENDDGGDVYNALISGIMLANSDGYLIVPGAYESSGAYELTVTELNLPDNSSGRLAITAPLLAAVERLVIQDNEAEALATLEEVATLYPELEYEPELIVQHMKAKWLVEQAENSLGSANHESARIQAQEAAGLATTLADTALNLRMCRLGQYSSLADVVAPACEFVLTEAATVAPGETVTGTITSGSAAPWRLVDVADREIILIIETTTPGLDPMLSLYAGSNLAYVENLDGYSGASSQIGPIRPGASENFLIEPNDWSEASGEYRLSVLDVNSELGRSIKIDALLDDAQDEYSWGSSSRAVELLVEAEALAQIVEIPWLDLRICRMSESFRETQTSQPACQRVLDTVPEISPGDVITGVIEAGQSNLWRLVDATEREVVIMMKAETSTLDPVLTLYAGEDLAELDRNDDFSGLNSQIGPKLLGAAGPFLIEAGTLNDRSGSYTLEVIDLNAIAGTERQVDMLIAEANRLITDGYGTEDYDAAIEKLDQALVIAPQLEATIQAAKAVALIVQAFAELDEGDEAGSATHLQAVHDITAVLSNSELDGLICEIVFEVDVDQSKPECQQAAALAQLLRPSEPVSGTFHFVDDGLLSLPGMVHAWRFEAAAGDVVTIRMWDADSGLDTALRVLGGTELREIAANDDYDNSDSQVGPLSLTETGTYLILAYASDYSHSGTYGLALAIE